MEHTKTLTGLCGLTEQDRRDANVQQFVRDWQESNSGGGTSESVPGTAEGQENHIERLSRADTIPIAYFMSAGVSLFVGSLVGDVLFLFFFFLLFVFCESCLATVSRKMESLLPL